MISNYYINSNFNNRKDINYLTIMDIELFSADIFATQRSQLILAVDNMIASLSTVCEPVKSPRILFANSEAV